MPATISISNNGASIKIDTGSSIRLLMKNQILEISIVKTNILKIDIGQGSLQNLFIPFDSVLSPVAANPAALRDLINDMMANSVNPVGGAGGATEAKQDVQISKQDEQTTKLNSLDTTVNAINTKATSIDASNTVIANKITNVDTTTDTIRSLVQALNNKIIQEPVIVDETNPNVTYQGYLDGGSYNENAAIWAIQQISNQDGIKRYKWADGNKNFDNVWANRESLTYQ